MWKFSRLMTIERAVRDTNDILVSEETIRILGSHGVQTIGDLSRHTPGELVETYGVDYYDALSLGHLMVKQRRAKSGAPKAEREEIQKLA